MGNMGGETNEILQRLARVETKLDMMLEDRDVATEALKTANEALSSSKSAHHRLNTHSKILLWAGTTVITTEITIILYLIGRVG